MPSMEKSNSPGNTSAKIYAVVDSHSKQVLSWHATRKFAQRKADRLDNQYGAYRYYVRHKDFILDRVKPS